VDTTDWFLIDADDQSWASFRRDRLELLRNGPLPDLADLDAALTLADAIGNWVEPWEERDTKDDPYLAEEALRTLQVVCHRLGIPADLTSSLRVGGGRRRHAEVWAMLEPVHALLLEKERDLLARGLEESGWPGVEREIDALRSAWRWASDAPGYSAVGNHALRVLEALSDIVGDPSVGRERTKNRIMGYLDQQSIGDANEDLKRICQHAIELAQGTKHDRAPSRIKAGSAATAAILLVSIVRFAGGT